MNTSKAADKMLVALVREYESNPAELVEPGFGLDVWDLAVKAGIIGQEEAEQRRQMFISGAMDNIPSIGALMKERDWVTSWEFGVYGRHSPALFPTTEGIDHAHSLMRPWYRKVWDFLRGDVRTIIVAIITAAIVAIVTTLIMRLLG